FYRVHAVPVTFETAYKVHRGEPVVTAPRSFRTLNPAAATASFTVWNDTHQNKETVRKLIALHSKEPGDFLMWNGDITNDVTTEQLLIDEYLNPAGEAYADSTPLFFSRGNHDVRGEAARLLSGYAPGLGGAYHYVFRHGPVGCVVLDTGEDKPDETPTYAGLNDFAAHRTAQRQWLERAIQDPAFSSAPFRIAIMHIPLFWDGDVPANWPSVWGGHHGWICEDGRKKWHDLLEKAGVRLVISGHTHRSAWFPPNAEHSYAQLTGGGPKPEQATTIRVQADAKKMQVRVANLAGKALFEETFAAASLPSA
ncbi:MAG: metallophosphoesterase, partial [Burkholderiales bacterium]